MRCDETVEYWPAWSISNIFARFSEWVSLLLSFSPGPQSLEDLAKGVTAWLYPELRGEGPALSET